VSALKQKYIVSDVLSENRKEENTFYKVKNFEEVYKLGKTYFDDYKNGIKCFAIASTGYGDSQQRTALGIASLFDSLIKIKICIVSDNLNRGIFKEFVEKSTEVELKLDEDISVLTYQFYSHFTFVDLRKISMLAHNFDQPRKIFKKLKDHYDVIFYDVPDLDSIRDDFSIYFSMVQTFDSVSIIVAQNISSEIEVNEVRDFFTAYGISLKGLVIDQVGEEKKSWRFK
jgi:hypothetical protein